MSTANELFTTASGADEAHIVINSDRSVSVPDELKNIAVQYDHNIESVTFDCPRYWDGNDLSTMTFKINYVKTDGSNGTYICGKPTIDSDNENLIHFDWLISNDVTTSSGSVKFIVCVQKLEAGEPVQVWHSQINNQTSVLPGLACDTGSISDYETGRLTEWAEFWSSFQDNGNRTDYEWGFNGPGWTDTTFKPKYDIKPEMIDWGFQYSKITDLKGILESCGVVLDTSKATTMDQMFESSLVTHIPVIDMTSVSSAPSMIFSDCPNLVEIEKIVLSPTKSGYSDWFGTSANLEEIRFENTILNPTFNVTSLTNLSHDTLVDIIAHIKDRSTETTKWQLKLGSTNSAKLTPEEIAVATAKGWNVI